MDECAHDPTHDRQDNDERREGDHPRGSPSTHPCRDHTSRETDTVEIRETMHDMKIEMINGVTMPL
jgi:hypothetical protein